jgi:hypothetical protein
MIAFGMNGEQLDLLNGFPFKLIVPGWCAVYWIKMHRGKNEQNPRATSCQFRFRQLRGSGS